MEKKKRGERIVFLIVGIILTIFLNSVLVEAGTTFDYDIVSDSYVWYVCDAYNQLSSTYPVDRYSSTYIFTTGDIRVNDDETLDQYVPETAVTTVQTIIGTPTSPQFSSEGISNVEVVPIDQFSLGITIAGVTTPNVTTGITIPDSQFAWSTPAAKDAASRFLCYGKGINSAFAECCGYSLDKCTTSGSTVRRTGGVPITIEEFTCPTAGPSNCVLKYGLSDLSGSVLQYHKLTFNLKNTGSKIYNWNEYDNLEFFMNFIIDSNQKLMILSVDTSISPYNMYNFPNDFLDNSKCPGCVLFDDNISKYITNFVEFDRWGHIVIPLNTSLTSKTNIQTLIFYVNKDVVQKEKILLDPAFGGGIFLSIIGLDRLSLSRNAKPRYCSASTYPKWIMDLDDNTLDSVVPGLGVPYGWLPCTFTPGYSWTGSKCCGDDQTHSYNETYIDTLDGCWSGYVVKNNTVVEIGSNLLYLDEQFHACNLPGQQFDPINVTLGAENVTNEPAGTLMGSWFCDFDYNWKDTDSSFARTKALAMQLLDFSESESAGNYTLFCDNYSKALNEYDYILDETIDYLKDGQINSICVLKYGEKVAIGTSINNNIDDEDSFLALLPGKSLNYCAFLSGDGPYYICSGDQSVWYNNKTKSIIYNKGGIINLQPTAPNFITRLFELIGRALGFYTESAASGMVQSATEFDKIYVNKLGSKEINGIMGSDFINVSYYDLDTNISKAVKKLKGLRGQPLFNYEYNSTNNVPVHIISSDKTQALGHWQELTSKIRLK